MNRTNSASLPTENQILHSDSDTSEAEQIATHYLLASENRVRMAMTAAKIGTFDWNLQTGEVSWSESLEESMGLPPGGFGKTLQSFIEFVHPEDRDKVQQIIKTGLETGAEYEAEFRMIRPNGSVRQAQVRLQAYFDEIGRPVRMVGINIDVSERKQVEEALRRSEAEAKARAGELEAILDAVPAMTFIAHDAGCQEMTSSRAAYELLRLAHGANTSKSAPEGERPTNFRVTKDGQEVPVEELPVQRAAATGQAVRNSELNLEFEDGGTCHIVGNAVPLLDARGSVRGAVGAFVDITERKRAEDALRRSENSLRLTFENAAAGIAHVALDGRWLQVNDKLCEIAGYSRDALLGIPFQAITHPDDLETDLRFVHQLITGEICQCWVQKRFIRPDQSIVWVDVSVSILRQADGTPDHFVCVITDSTGRKLAEDHLRAREKELLESREQLEQRVGERTAELAAANQGLRDLTSRLLQMQDDERRRLSRELHDSVGQVLAALSLNCGRLGRETQSETGSAILKDSKELIDQMNTEIRTISYLLHPPLLDQTGLLSAVRWFVQGFSERSKIKVQLDIPTDFGRLSEEMEITIFRVIQECLTNVHRHSGSRTATVRIARENGHVLVEIQDAGKGIPVEKQSALRVSGPLSVGLAGMRERAAQLGGTLELQSSAAGTVVKATLPYRKTASAAGG